MFVARWPRRGPSSTWFDLLELYVCIMDVYFVAVNVFGGIFAAALFRVMLIDLWYWFSIAGAGGGLL